MKNITKLFVFGILIVSGSANSTEVKTLEELQMHAQSITHSSSECPQKISGEFCYDVNEIDPETGDHITMICVDPSLKTDSSGVLTYSSGEGSLPMTVDGKVHQITEQGMTVSMLGYCSDNKLTTKLIVPGLGYYSQTIRSLDNGNKIEMSSKMFQDGIASEESQVYTILK